MKIFQASDTPLLIKGVIQPGEAMVYIKSAHDIEVLETALLINMQEAQTQEEYEKLQAEYDVIRISHSKEEEH